jgi:hypothetical protein
LIGTTCKIHPVKIPERSLNSIIQDIAADLSSLEVSEGCHSIELNQKKVELAGKLVSLSQKVSFFLRAVLTC